jgi:hypothetical protein
MGIGLYESVRYEFENSESFSSKLYQMPEMPGRENGGEYDWQVSANAAMASMVRSFNGGLTPANHARIDSLENAYNQKLTAEGSNSRFNRSQAFGRSIAAKIYDWSLTDNINASASNAGYIPPVFPGSWVPTPPAFANAVLPYLTTARTYIAEHATLSAPAFSITYSEDPGSDFYKMARNVYDVNQSLTTGQKDIALFWIDQGNGIGLTPAGHDLSVVVQALEQVNSTLPVAAEALAKAGIAERDATVVCFRSKYLNNVVRPVTYIRKLIDPNWMPFITTPPHPEYPAAHAFITGSVMQAVTHVLGDNVTFTDHSYEFRGLAPRTYTSLFNAGEDAGISRLYGGIHYLGSINAGLSLARTVGNRVGEIRLHE